VNHSKAARFALLVFGLAALGAGPKDPLAVEIERWQAFTRDNASTDETWIDVKQSAQPMLESAAEALRDGRRLLAMQRLALASANLGAAAYLAGRAPEVMRDGAGFRAEWTRMGTVLRAELGAPSPDALAGVAPAALRALGESALLQVRGYYETGLEYGQNTMAKYGLYYVGTAQAQRDFATLTRTLSEPSTKAPPRLRSLSVDLDRLEDQMLAAYRPPAAIEKHGQFIGASSSLKEARELDAAGLRYGALYKYLQAAMRLGVLGAPPGPVAAGSLSARLADLDVRLAAGNTDNSIGRLFLEMAQADVAAARPDEPPVAAEAIATDVLPRYFAALEPGKPAAPKAAPAVTVTLVRWPYT
jgi:hypothetical protein